MTLLELSIAAGMLSVLLVTAVQMLRLVSNHQLAADRRIVAMQTVQALAEQIGNTPWDELTADSIAQITVPDAVAAYLPGASLAMSLSDEPQPVPAKRVTIELKWHAPSGQRAGPVRLTTWVFSDESSAAGYPPGG